MALPLYPPELPRPEASNYQEAFGDGRLQGRTDAGPPVGGRRFSSVVNTVQFSTLLRRSQLARFQRFYDEDTRQGSLPFLIPDPTTDGWMMMTDTFQPILNEAGLPLLLSETWVVMFGATLPRITTSRPPLFSVMFELSVMP